MKYMSLFFFIGFFLLTGVGCFPKAEAGTQKSDEIIVGVIAPLTGPGQRLGEWILQGVEVAKERILVDGGKIKVIVQDSQCNARAAIDAYEYLKLQGVQYILGPLCSAAAVPVMPMAERDGILLMTSGLASNPILNGGDNIYSLLPSMRAMASTLTQFAQGQLSANTFALLYADDEFGLESRLGIESVLEETPSTLRLAEQYKKGNIDFRTLLTKVEEAHPDALFVFGYAPEYVALIRQMKEMNIKIPLLLGHTMQARETVAEVWGEGFDIYYPYPKETDSELLQVFKESYATSYSEELSVLSMSVSAGHDGLILLYTAAGECADQGVSCVQNKLHNISYDGFGGLVEFDTNGNNSNPQKIEIRRVQNGGISTISL